MNPFFRGLSPWGYSSLGALGIVLTLLGIILGVLIIVLKGYALWHAARRSEKGWFIALFILNTLGILDLVYLYFVVGKWHTFASGTPAGTLPSV